MVYRLKNIFSFILVLFFLYLFINVEVILWEYLDPDGFWGLIWFYLISAVLLMAFMALLNYIEMIIMLRRKEKTGFGTLIAIGLFFLLGGIIYISPTLLVARALKDRYKYIERSDKYFSEGRFDEAITYAEKVYNKAINKKPTTSFLIVANFYDKSRYGIKSRDIKIYQSTINYAYCLQASGKDLNKAERLFIKCKELAVNRFNEDQKFKIIPLLGLSKLYMAKGNNQNIEKCYLELSPLLTKENKSDIYLTIQTFLYYASYFNKIGDLEQAANFRKQSLSLYEKSFKNSKGLTYLTLLLLVVDDYLNYDLDSAEGTMFKAKKIAKKNKDNLLYVYYLILNAKLLEIKGELEKSELTLLDVIKQIKDRQGEKHIQFAQSLGSLASFYFRHGEVHRAAYYFNKALLIAQQYPNSQEFYSILLGSALADFSTNSIQSSINKIKSVENYLLKQINENFGLLTEEEQEKYVSFIEKQFNLINEIYVKIGDPEHLGYLYNNILALKSIALQSHQYLKSYIQNSGDRNFIKSYNSLVNAKEKLSKLKTSGTTANNVLTNFQDSINISEKYFLEKLTGSSQYKRFKVNSITWKDVRNVLKDNEATIEFFNIPNNLCNPKTSQYYALLVKSNFSSPVLISLASEKELSIILNQEGTVKIRIGKIYGDSTIGRLYNCIWRPVKQYLSGSKRIYISLAGILNQVSFPALTINENVDIIYLGSTRKLVPLFKQSSESIKPLAALYGGISYDKSSKETNTQKQPGIYNKKIIEDLQRFGVRPLPGTKVEIENIAKILSNREYDTLVFTGQYATKSSFEKLEFNQPLILHLATHGFYFPPDQSYRLNDLMVNSSNISSFQNPLYRSGLLFAGVNRTKSEENKDNGILTGFEISKIDLSNVDLVVLSACETGLGDIRGGEGVYGLQRAFKLSGANSIVISLWKVDDKITSELMQKFYSYYLSDAKYSKQEALKAAQKKIREKHPNPYYWAAFTIFE